MINKKFAFAMDLQRFAEGVTKKANMVDPQVMADMISAKLDKAIRFTPLADVDSTLSGRPGSEITVPRWNYIGDASDIAEGEAIPLDQMTTASTKMTIKKAGKGVEITDEAILSGLGDPIGEAENQMLMAISNKIDNDLLASLSGAVQTATDLTKGLTVEQVDAGIAVFDDEDDAAIVLVCNPKDAMDLKADAGKNWLSGTELGANVIIRGTFGEISGAQVVRSKKLARGSAYLIKVGALRIVKKRDVEVESDRDIVKKTTVITADEHYGTYLYDPTKVVKLTFTKA